MSDESAKAVAIPPYWRELDLKRECLQIAVTLSPKDARDLISKAAGIYKWLTSPAPTAEGILND